MIDPHHVSSEEALGEEYSKTRSNPPISRNSLLNEAMFLGMIDAVRICQAEAEEVNIGVESVAKSKANILLASLYLTFIWHTLSLILLTVLIESIRALAAAIKVSKSNSTALVNRVSAHLF